MNRRPASDRIQPWAQDRRYWQYRGRPVLLLGGSREDNLFQIADLETHLDLLASCGGNYIRNTMSDRDPGDERAWLRQPGGRYDITQWNPAYWQRLEKLLELTAERDIIVQIEVWDRFDFSRAFWRTHPLNPDNCASSLPADAGLVNDYPEHPSADKQPFFHTASGSKGYEPRLDGLRGVQEAFVDRLLSHTLPYGHVLYCMNNETSTDPAWGRYWMAHIHKRAAEANVNVCVTDMFDDAHRPAESKSFAQVLSDARTYDFVEISQVNSRNFGAEHWERIRWVCQRTGQDGGRPVNHVKVYSDGRTSFGSGTPQDGVERFWRNVLAGSAAVRFHRPTSGLGLSPLAQACLRSVRMAEHMMPMWTLRADDALVRGAAETNRAYAAANERGEAVVFICRGEEVELAWPAAGDARVQWIAVASGSRIGEQRLKGEVVLKLAPPLSGLVAAVVRGY